MKSIETILEPVSNYKQKPFYNGCDGTCGIPGSKKCWKMGHIPYAGYLVNKYYSNHSPRIIFKRFVRMKKIVWPDEAVWFCEMFAKKHPEIPLQSFIKTYEFTFCLGAYWHKSYFVEPLFGDRGLLPEPPISPKKELRDIIFLKLSTKHLIKKLKYYEYTRQFDDQQRRKN